MVLYYYIVAAVTAQWHCGTASLRPWGPSPYMHACIHTYKHTDMMRPSKRTQKRHHLVLLWSLIRHHDVGLISCVTWWVMTMRWRYRLQVTYNVFSKRICKGAAGRGWGEKCIQVGIVCVRRILFFFRCCGWCFGALCHHHMILRSSKTFFLGVIIIWGFLHSAFWDYYAACMMASYLKTAFCIRVSLASIFLEVLLWKKISWWCCFVACVRLFAYIHTGCYRIEESVFLGLGGLVSYK